MNGNIRLGKHDKLAFIQKQGVYLAFIIVVSIFAFLSPAFLSPFSIMLMFRQNAVFGIMACTTTLVLISGNFDLAIGSIVSFSAVAVIQLYNAFGPVVAFFSVLALGAVFGAISGFLVGYLKLNSMIVTLGMLNIVQAITFIVSGGTISSYGKAKTWLMDLGRGSLFGSIPTPTVIWVIMIFVFAVLLTRTVFGRQLMSVGGNSLASLFSGINEKRVVFITYIMSGLTAALAGIVLAGRVGSTQNIAGVGYEFEVITAAILGGTSLMGGKGSLIKTAIGVLTLGVLRNGLIMIKMDSNWQWLANGFVILIFVAIDVLAQRQKLKVKV